MNNLLENLQRQIEPLKREIVEHQLYAALRDFDDVRIFMEFHVFAVWDFMSLLKTLQANLTCVRVPWVPTGDAETRFLINEIVTGEESDVDRHGTRTSHFEMYLAAMRKANADVSVIEKFLQTIENTTDVRRTIAASELAPAIKHFLDFTFEVIETEKPHIQAAVFTFGREDLIPQMFLSLVADLERQFPEKIADFKYYFHRHIEVDGDEHSHLALAMTKKLCGDDAAKWREAEDYVVRGLKARTALWNGVLESLNQTSLRAAT